MATELEELQALNAAFAEFVTYEKARDAAADAAAVVAADAAAADAVAADAAAAEKVLQDAAMAEITLQEKQAETEFRADVLEKSTQMNDLLILFNEKEFPTTVDNSALLTQIVDNTSVSEFENEVGSLSYYANVGIIILIFGILPIYLAYRFIRPIIGMVNKII